MKTLITLALAMAVSMPAFAGNIVKCTSDDGHITYQEYDCPADSADKAMMNMLTGTSEKFQAPKVDKSKYRKVDSRTTVSNHGGDVEKRVMDVYENGYGDHMYKHYTDGRLVSVSY